MIDWMRAGEIPEKPHTVFRPFGGQLAHEECLTRRGFDGEFSILYHLNPPAADVDLSPAEPGPLERKIPVLEDGISLKRRLFLGDKAPSGYTPVLFNSDVTVSFFRIPPLPAARGFANGDGDDLFFVFSGSGRVETPFGDLPLRPLDYLLIPRGIVHRFVSEEELEGIVFEMRGGFHLPSQFRNPAGQLRMDAPFTHRDFIRPEFRGPREGPSEILIKKDDHFVLRRPAHSPFDIVGWDGALWPFVFPILKYQPKTGLVHLPPTIHSTFAGRGVLVCSFVPRLTDTHPAAIPCPYPHSSVDCDEVIYYVRGNFTSRRGVGARAASLHPAGIPHGPHPGAYEASIGTASTEELAVMIDTFQPLRISRQGLLLESTGYHESWRA